jgi:hypothetical protein
VQPSGQTDFNRFSTTYQNGNVANYNGDFVIYVLAPAFLVVIAVLISPANSCNAVLLSLSILVY